MVNFLQSPAVRRRHRRNRVVRYLIGQPRSIPLEGLIGRNGNHGRSPYTVGRWKLALTRLREFQVSRNARGLPTLQQLDCPVFLDDFFRWLERRYPGWTAYNIAYSVTGALRSAWYLQLTATNAAMSVRRPPRPGGKRMACPPGDVSKIRSFARVVIRSTYVRDPVADLRRAMEYVSAGLAFMQTECALRPGEIRGLELDDIDLDAGCIRVRSNQYRDLIRTPYAEREVPLLPGTLRVVEIYVRVLRSWGVTGPAFPNLRGLRPGDPTQTAEPIRDPNVPLRLIAAMIGIKGGIDSFGVTLAVRQQRKAAIAALTFLTRHEWSDARSIIRSEHGLTNQLGPSGRGGLRKWGRSFPPRPIGALRPFPHGGISGSAPPPPGCIQPETHVPLTTMQWIRGEIRNRIRQSRL